MPGLPAFICSCAYPTVPRASTDIAVYLVPFTMYLSHCMNQGVLGKLKRKALPLTTGSGYKSASMFRSNYQWLSEIIGSANTLSLVSLKQWKLS